MSESKSSRSITVDAAGLGRRICTLLRLDSEENIEIQLLRDGSVRAVRLDEKEGKMKDAAHL